MSAPSLREPGHPPVFDDASMAPLVRAGSMPIPGQPWRLRWRRDDEGRLLELGCGVRTHLIERDGLRHFGDGLATVSELQDGRRLLRVVYTPSGSWVEEYRVDADGRTEHVDGVDIHRDAAGRVVRAGAWSYAYAGDALTMVEGPRGRRTIERDAEGRPTAVRDAAGGRAFAHDQAGRRTDAAPLPGTHHRDQLGRLWTVTGADGRVVTTYLWEGPWCLGRIDGDAREPLAAVFSLDPTATPVRIIERRGARRVPRDAFGEALLSEEGVPGLFGAVVHAGLHHLPARPLDPCVGSFCAPDPWNAGPGDPRRSDGRDIPLVVEQPGEYVICRNDPVGRTDPTGCISGTAALVAFSSLTWSSPTTVFSILGFDLGLNFWLSLFSGQIGDYFGSFGDGMAAKRHGGFAVRRGGLLGLPRAFTIGHYVMHDKLTYRGYDLISAFVPSSPMPLTGYGTLLQLTPKEGGTFLLDGSTGIPGVLPARGWTRGGGVGTPVYPGATVARYDSGGLHIDRTQSTAGSTTVSTGGASVASANVFGPQDCTLTELAPTGVWAAGISLANLIAVTLTGTSLGIAVGNLQLLTHTTKDTTGATVIDSATIASVLNVVEDGGNTEVTLESSGSGVLTPLRLRALGPPGTAETASAVAAKPGYLSTAGTTSAYAPGDPLRLSQAAGTAGLVPVGAAVVLRLEAQLAIDAALPATDTALSLTLLSAGASAGPADITSPTTIRCTGAVPPVPSLIAITVPGGTVPVATKSVADNPAGGRDVTLDRPVSLTGSGSWAPLVPSGGAFGSAQKADVPATITYAPTAPRTTPAVGAFIRVEANQVSPTARIVTAVNYDALVLSALPGNTGAPYSVERFSILSVDQDNLRFTQKVGLAIDPVLTPPANQTLPGVALRLHELAGPTLAAAAAGATTPLSGVPLVVAGASLTAPLSAPVSTTNPAPGQLMLLSNGAATLELTVVTGLLLTVNCDRAWNGAAKGLEAIPIADGGPAYVAVPVPGTALVMRVGNAVLGGTPPATTTVITEMPRFAEGEIVRLTWSEGTPTPVNELFRISSVEAFAAGGTVLIDSTTITLVDGGRAPSPTATAFTVTRQVPIAPATNVGTTREGLNGDLLAVPAAGTNPQMRFSVWRTGALAAADYAVSDGTTARPMRFVAPSSTLGGALAIQLGAAPASFAAGAKPTLLIPRLAPAPPAAPIPPSFASTVYAASFTQVGNVVRFAVHPDEPNVLLPGSGNIIVAVSFGASAPSGTPAVAAAATSGTLKPGTVLIPEDTSYELTLREGLVEHETRHTMQYSWFGPLMWGFLPILPLLEKVYPGLDTADYSPTFDAVLIQGPGESRLRFDNLGGTSLSEGDSVAASLNIPFTLGKKSAAINDPAGSAGFLISDADFQKLRSVADSSGKLSMRKVLHDGGVGLALGKFFGRDLPAFLTPGGATEFAVANTWGWFVYGAARLIYGLNNRLSGGGGTTYDGTVSDDGAVIVVSEVSGRDALSGVSRILVQHGDSTVIRSATSSDGDGGLTLKLSLTEPLTTLKGVVVRVAPYDTHQPASDWDWSHYYPAKVPDDTRPATIVVQPADAAGKDTLVLKLQDQVLLRTGNTSKRSVVTAVNADGSVDLEDPPMLALGKGEAIDREFRIAKVGEHDPVGSLGGLTANFIRAPWLGKLSDPWSWILNMPNVKPGSGGDWALRVLRWIASSRAWSMAFPGWLWLDDLFKGSGSFAAWMEQDASENSGDLYTSLGRLEHAPSVVGDIGRYWFFPNGRYSSSYPRGRFDNAGAQMRREVVVAPLVTPETSGGVPTINKGAGSPALPAPPPGGGLLPVGPGDFVPDALYAKNAGDPRQAAGTPASFVPNDRGRIPLSGALERSEGAYVAYTRPGKHRATIIEGFNASGIPNEVRDARQVVDKGAGFGLKDVTLFFDQTIADLAVRIDGVPVNNDDTVTLVLTQTARVLVVPSNPARRYALTLQQPLTSPLLRADLPNGDATTIQVQAPASLPAVTSEPVELSRVYRYDAAAGAFDEPALNAFKMNLPGDVRVPVRRFTVAVTNRIAARSKVSTSSADDVSALTSGTDLFVLVPAAVTNPLSAAISYSPAAPAGTKDPVVTIAPEPLPAALASAGVTGTAFKVSTNRNDPPEVPATVALSVGVGAGSLSATLTGTLTFNPAFVLDAAGGVFSVARGGTLVLTAHDPAAANVNVSAVDPLAGITITVSNATITLVVAASAATGNRRVVATLQSDASGQTKGARTITIT